MVLDIIMVVFGAYLMVVSLLASCTKTVNRILFKVIPFFGGLYALVYSVLNMGIMSLNI